jgi:hypothetical protein
MAGHMMLFSSSKRAAALLNISMVNYKTAVTHIE